MAHNHRASLTVFCKYRFLGLPNLLDCDSLSELRYILGSLSPTLRPASLLLLQYRDYLLYDV